MEPLSEPTKTMWYSAVGCLVTLALSLLAAPLTAHGQPAKVPRLGYLNVSTGPGTEAFLKRMRELGWVEGQNITIERRFYASQQPSDYVAELLRLPVDVLFVAGPTALTAAATATREVPIVALDLESDPVEAGFAASLARPGGNITGVFLDLPGLIGKWVEWLKAIEPPLARVGILWDSTTGRAQVNAATAAAQSLTVEPHILEVASADALDRALALVPQTRAGALLVLSSPLLFVHTKRLADFTLRHRLPAIALFREFPESNGLMAYGPDRIELFVRCAAYVDKLLKGAKIGDLPIERPLRFTLVLNLKTATALGLTIPPILLFQRIGSLKGILPRRCHRSPLARLRRRPLLARGEGGVPSTQRLHAAAARSKDWRGFVRSGQAAQDA